MRLFGLYISPMKKIMHDSVCVLSFQQIKLTTRMKKKPDKRRRRTSLFSF